MSIIAEIKRVLRIQSSSLTDLMKQIGPPYRQAVLQIFRCKGKIIVTGIGKSGLVAQKIASTFASTGTPAIYLHPVEGMHGNLGLVHKDDIILAIGKSGESEELLRILPVIKKIGAKIIALTSNKNSSLAREASLILHIPCKKEASPGNLVPTISSTLALVVGDAMAMALMKLRNFGPDKFALYHPGGMLGKLTHNISEIMRGGRRNPMVKVNASINKLLNEISKKWTGAASVVDLKGRLIGLVTDYDIRQAFSQGKSVFNLEIKDIMNPNPTFIGENEKIIKALEMMESRKKPLTILPVVDHKKRCVGMIHLHDLIAKGFVQRFPHGSSHRPNHR